MLAAVISIAAAVGVVAVVRYRNERLNREAARLASLLGAFGSARLAEVGAGRGTMAFRIAQRLGPAGLMMATEVDQKRLANLRNKLQGMTVRNLVVVAGTQDDTGLPPSSCQGIYLRGSYHHLTRPEELNRSLFQALKPGGVLAVIDFPPRLLLLPWTPKGIPENRGGHGIREDLVIEELTNAGLRFLQALENWPGSMYCLLFQKP